MKRKKKKGETRHHISYNPEIVVLISSRGAHRILTAFQQMNPTRQNIMYLKNFKKALNYIIKEKVNYGKNKRD